jgi:hypothetical protein
MIVVVLLNCDEGGGGHCWKMRYDRVMALLRK